MTHELDARIEQVENGLFADHEPAYTPRHSLRERMADYRVPAVSVAVISGGEIAWTKAYGVRATGQPNTLNTEPLFQAASISKPVAALAILRLVEAGHFDLDTDVNTYLTAWQVPPTDGWQPRLTLRQLLSHSAGTTVHGFLGYNHAETVPTPVQILDGVSPANSDPVRVDTLPGARYRYSGGGISIAQQVAADVLGKPFAEIVYEWALKPLGMTHSTYAQPLPEPLFANVAPGHYYTGETVEGGWYTMPELAAAGMWTTPSDLARFLIALRRAYTGDASPISQQVAQWMLTETIPADNGLSVGLGIFLKRWEGAATCEHSGGNVGYKCNAKIYFEGGDHGAVVMTNADYGYMLVQEVFNSIGAAYGWQQPPSAAKPASDVPFSDYAGTYQLTTGLKLSVAREGETLTAQVGQQPPLQLHALADGKYRLSPLNAAISFAREEAGGAVGIRFEQNGQVLSGVRVS
jgi:CubicO group peptidase (beta-lactamase class C family)